MTRISENLTGNKNKLATAKHMRGKKLELYRGFLFIKVRVIDTLLYYDYLCDIGTRGQSVSYPSEAVWQPQGRQNARPVV